MNLSLHRVCSLHVIAVVYNLSRMFSASHICQPFLPAWSPTSPEITTTVHCQFALPYACNYRQAWKNLAFSLTECLPLISSTSYVLYQAYCSVHTINCWICSTVNVSNVCSIHGNYYSAKFIFPDFSLTFQDKMACFPWLICSPKIPMLSFNRLQSH